MPWARGPWRRLLALLVVLLTACTPARREVQGDIVRAIHFEGNGGSFSGHNDYQLRLQMEQGDSPAGLLTFPLMYFVSPEVLDEEALARDGWRLEVWYAHHGWFDARFLGWRIRQARWPGEHRAGVVDVLGSFDLGPRSSVRTLTIEGLDGQLATFDRMIRRTGGVVEGEPFDLDAVDETAAQLVDLLQNHAHAYAHVETAVEAWPEEQVVDVAFEVTPGLAAAFGPVRFSGQERLPERLLRPVLGFEEGEGFRVKTLREAQQRLFELGMFSLVTLRPDLSDPTRAEVPIEVQLTETRFRSVRLGAGVHYDGFWLSPRAQASFSDKDLFHSLLEFETTAFGGYVLRLSEGDSSSTGLPVFGGDLSLTYPWLARHRLSLNLNGRYEQDLLAGQLYYRKVEAGLGARWQATREVLLTLDPGWEFQQYIGDSAELADLLFRGDASTPNPYRLARIDLGAVLDWRDDKLTPRRGVYAALDLRQAVPFLTGDFLFTTLNVDMKGYRPIKVGGGFPLVAAGRLHARVTQPWGGSVPYAERAFLGGANSLRGFRANQVGSYDCICSYADNGDVTRNYVADGGLIAAELETELRYDTPLGVTVAVFGEVGLLAGDWFEVDENALRYGGGVGARYQSPVGPIRLDLGMRPLFPEDHGPTLTYGCNANDGIPRAFDLMSLTTNARSNVDNHAPIAVNLFFSIGEAI